MLWAIPNHLKHQLSVALLSTKSYQVLTTVRTVMKTQYSSKNAQFGKDCQLWTLSGIWLLKTDILCLNQSLSICSL